LGDEHGGGDECRCSGIGALSTLGLGDEGVLGGSGTAINASGASSGESDGGSSGLLGSASIVGVSLVLVFGRGAGNHLGGFVGGVSGGLHAGVFDRSPKGGEVFLGFGSFALNLGVGGVVDFAVVISGGGNAEEGSNDEGSHLHFFIF
jgi:hypothetical protein